jgi:drug/metabolite transporter (DMT)-like permease
VGRLVLALAILAISWGSILARLCASPPLTIAFFRLAVAALILTPWGLPSTRAAAGRRPAWAGAALAGLLLALHFATWIASLSYTTIAASTVLVSTQPVASILLSRLWLGERASGRTTAAVLLALGGIVLITWSDLHAAGEGRLLGDLLALLGAVCAAAYLVIGRRMRAGGDFSSYLWRVNLSAAVASALLAAAAGQPLWPSRRIDLLWFLLMGLVPHVLGHGALNWSVRRLRAYVVNLAVLGEPVLASFYALWIFGEAPPIAVYPGALLIGAGVALAVAGERRRQAEDGARAPGGEGGVA